jgi:hypothetical protein
MDNNELKEALMSGSPVTHNGIPYKCVSAIIYRKRKDGKIHVEAELQSRDTNSISICDPRKIQRAEA